MHLLPLIFKNVSSAHNSRLYSGLRCKVRGQRKKYSNLNFFLDSAVIFKRAVTLTSMLLGNAVAYNLSKICVPKTPFPIHGRIQSSSISGRNHTPQRRCQKKNNKIINLQQCHTLIVSASVELESLRIIQLLQPTHPSSTRCTNKSRIINSLCLLPRNSPVYLGRQIVTLAEITQFIKCYIG